MPDSIMKRRNVSIVLSFAGVSSRYAFHRPCTTEAVDTDELGAAACDFEGPIRLVSGEG